MVVSSLKGGNIWTMDDFNNVAVLKEEGTSHGKILLDNVNCGIIEKLLPFVSSREGGGMKNHWLTDGDCGPKGQNADGQLIDRHVNFCR